MTSWTDTDRHDAVTNLQADYLAALTKRLIESGSVKKGDVLSDLLALKHKHTRARPGKTSDLGIIYDWFGRLEKVIDPEGV